MDKNETSSLTNQLCFPLYVCSKELVKLYRPYLDSLNLTYTQYIAMMVFWEEKCINVKELGEKLYLDSGTLTPVLKNLEAKGYLRRYRSRKDERVLLVEVTEAGMALKAEAEAIPEKVESELGMEKEDVLALRGLLEKVLASL